jgi:hypothetical protein
MDLELYLASTLLCVQVLNKAVGRLFLAKRKNKNSKHQTWAGHSYEIRYESIRQAVASGKKLKQARVKEGSNLVSRFTDFVWWP